MKSFQRLPKGVDKVIIDYYNVNEDNKNQKSGGLD